MFTSLHRVSTIFVSSVYKITCKDQCKGNESRVLIVFLLLVKRDFNDKLQLLLCNKNTIKMTNLQSFN